MDMAPVYGTGDSRFDSVQGLSFCIFSRHDALIPCSGCFLSLYLVCILLTSEVQHYSTSQCCFLHFLMFPPLPLSWLSALWVEQVHNRQKMPKEPRTLPQRPAVDKTIRHLPKVTFFLVSLINSIRWARWIWINTSTCCNRPSIDTSLDRGVLGHAVELTGIRNEFIRQQRSCKMPILVERGQCHNCHWVRLNFECSQKFWTKWTV